MLKKKLNQYSLITKDVVNGSDNVIQIRVCEKTVHFVRAYVCVCVGGGVNTE